ncbi:hypothetical protein [Aquabacterium sp.]|uniref:hypothetical protein n=1 Tax=Aquabacterium sp. TaxID=1872578 RepID=UPI003D6D1C42
MGLLDVLTHLVNFFLPALGMALLLPALARLVWWRALKPAGYGRQVKWAAGANALVLVAGLIVLGRDGAMATYAALVLVSALTVWWTGLR